MHEIDYIEAANQAIGGHPENFIKLVEAGKQALSSPPPPRKIESPTVYHIHTNCARGILRSF